MAKKTSQPKPLSLGGLYPYPSDLPTAEGLQIIIDAFHGNPVDTWMAVHCVWQAAGYAAKQFEPNVTGVGSAPALSAVDAASEVAKIKAHFETGGSDEGMKAANVPWANLLPALGELFAKLIGQLFNK